ncbi:hypothetical protein N9N03_01150 [Chlamydiia bacterium]|nr:hypothetical protein [Chlamydiia bacterium]
MPENKKKLKKEVEEGIISRIVRFFYPDIESHEVTKFGLFAMAFFFIIGTYWVLRLMKDELVFSYCFPNPKEVLNWNIDGLTEWWPKGYGGRLQPKLKLYSAGVVFALVMVYTQLIDMFKKHKLFYIFSAVYMSLFTCVAGVLVYSELFGKYAAGKTLLATTGIASYFLIESFGSLVISLFWSFTNSCFKSSEAKRSYAFLIAVAQIGSITGSASVGLRLPNSAFFFLSVLLIGGVAYTVKYIIDVVPEEQLKSDATEKKQKPDLLAGARLLFTRPYLLGVLVVSTFYEIAKTVIDYEMKTLGNIVMGASEGGFKAFLSTYGVLTNSLAFLIAILGASKIIKRYGVRFSLMLYPVLFAIALIVQYVYFQSSGITSIDAELAKANPDLMVKYTSLLYVTMGTMLFVTAISYAVNNPTKEMMYIPTSKDAKFKAKGLVDMVGGRSAKMSGAQITNNFKSVPIELFTVGSYICFGIVGIWTVVALYVGTRNQQLVKEKKIIE